MPRASFCRTCRRPILWGVTSAGRRIPIDTLSVANGNIILGDWKDGTVEVAIGKPGTGTHQSHFVSCPTSAAHRRGPRR